MRIDAETRTLLVAAAALMGLLAAAIGTSFIHLGPFNLPAALAIAAVKALIVVMFFMEVRAGSRLIWIMAGLGLMWFLILFSGTVADYLTREVIVPPF